MKRKHSPSHSRDADYQSHHSKPKRQKKMDAQTAELPPRAKDPAMVRPDGTLIDSEIRPEHEDAFRKAWSILDEDDEKVTLSMEEKFGNIRDKLKQSVPDVIQRAQTGLSGKLKELKSAVASGSVTDPDYTGPHVPDEFSIEVSKGLLEAFSKGKILHEDYATRVFSGIRRMLKRGPTVNEISIPAGGKVTVVGDTHGQLTDLITIFRIAGFPSKTNIFLFNGDYVDRGPQDVEIILTLYSMKLADPDTIFFNRGNHEQRHMNEKYNFENNVRDRYTPVMFELVQKTFKYLPLASIIEGKVYVTHGGLFPYDDVTLDEIKNLERWTLKKGKPADRAATLMQCMLWSDPHDEEGWKKSDRGAGILWGPDITRAFIKNNNLDLVIRSHEMVDEGTKMLHHDHCMTLFSASNYTGTNENQGAVVVFSNPSNLKDYQVHRYFADAIFDDKQQVAPAVARKSETLQKLRERIFQERHGLSLEFYRLDEEHTGRLSVAKFVQALQTVIQLPLNWEVLWRYLAKPESENKDSINYTKFLDRYKMAVEEAYWTAWADNVVSRLCQRLYQHGFGSVKDAFASIDIDNNGSISYAEFVDVLKSFDLGLSEAQMYDLIRSIDSNKDAQIDYEEFLERFESAFNVAAAEVDNEAFSEEASKSLLQISKVIHKTHENLRAAFSQVDKNGSGRINKKEWVSFVQSLPDLQSVDADKLYIFLDKNNSGSVSYKEFKRALRPVVAKKDGSEGSAFYDGVIQNVCDVLHRSKVQLRSAFRMMDIDGSGKIDVAEFKAGLEALNVLLEVPLSDSQIKNLHAAIDKDHDGTISYEEFLESFSVVDKDDQ